MENILTEIRLDLPKTSMETDDASKVVTYQCLCQVKGRMKFKLVTARYVEGFIIDPDDVLDEVVVESPPGVSGFAFTDTMLVNLRGQVSAHGSDPKYAVVWIENLIPTEILSAARVYWQQAWGGTEAEDQAEEYPLSLGLANSGQVRTPNGDPVPNTYNWAVNALGIKAASRFQLPLLDTRPSEGEEDPGGDAQGMGWLSSVSAEDYDLVDGEMYFDANQFAVLGTSDTAWRVFSQPDRFRGNITSGDDWTGGMEKNIIYSGTNANYTLNLDTNVERVPQGTIVRVFNFIDPGVNLAAVNVVVGTSLATVSRLHMGEFLFWNDGGTGRWLVVVSNGSTNVLPAV